MTSDGVKQYQWDGENRLIAVKQGPTTIAEYAYDYQSRRISKTVGASVKSFVYDGWNPIAEYTSALSPLSFALSTSFTWGMDLSGSMQGAGGVGGLLSVNDGSDTYFPSFDGNGNVSEYVDDTGSPVAHYEYDAFGQVVSTGSMKDDFTHQFSTKQLDSESGLHYYGYRYYDSSNGRWLGRDPIAERGGVNLYGFVRNVGVSKIDYLGLKLTVLVLAQSSEVETNEGNRVTKWEGEDLGIPNAASRLVNDVSDSVKRSKKLFDDAASSIDAIPDEKWANWKFFVRTPRLTYMEGLSKEQVKQMIMRELESKATARYWDGWQQQEFNAFFNFKSESHDQSWYAAHGNSNGETIRLGYGSWEWRDQMHTGSVQCMSFHLNGQGEVKARVIDPQVKIATNRCSITLDPMKLEIQ